MITLLHLLVSLLLLLLYLNDACLSNMRSLALGRAMALGLETGVAGGARSCGRNTWVGCRWTILHWSSEVECTLYTLQTEVSIRGGTVSLRSTKCQRTLLINDIFTQLLI